MTRAFEQECGRRGPVESAELRGSWRRQTLSCTRQGMGRVGFGAGAGGAGDVGFSALLVSDVSKLQKVRFLCSLPSMGAGEKGKLLIGQWM